MDLVYQQIAHKKAVFRIGMVFEYRYEKHVNMEMQPLTIIATLLTLVPVILIIKTAVSMVKDKRLY
jgi:hypothetical protein